MAKSDYVERVDGAFATQMLVFKNNIGPHATVLDVTPAEVAEQAADADYYQYMVVCLAMLVPYAKGMTKYRDNLRFGEQPGQEKVAPPERPQAAIDEILHGRPGLRINARQQSIGKTLPGKYCSVDMSGLMQGKSQGIEG